VPAGAAPARRRHRDPAGPARRGSPDLRGEMTEILEELAWSSEPPRTRWPCGRRALRRTRAPGSPRSRRSRARRNHHHRPPDPRQQPPAVETGATRDETGRPVTPRRQKHTAHNRHHHPPTPSAGTSRKIRVNVNMRPGLIRLLPRDHQHRPVATRELQPRQGLLHRAVLGDLDSRSSCARQVNDHPERCWSLRVAS
jgi:hypothetical protein